MTSENLECAIEVHSCETKVESHLTIQSRTRARDLSVEEVGGSDIIQTMSQKSWLIPTAHVLQIFDTFRNKLANVKRCTIGMCFSIKDPAHKTIKMSVSGVKFI